MHLLRGDSLVTSLEGGVLVYTSETTSVYFFKGSYQIGDGDDDDNDEVR